MTNPRDVRTGHLDAPTIAALVDRTLDDRTLDPAARAAAEAHLAACADCREVWVETSEMVSEAEAGGASAPKASPAPRAHSRRWMYGGAGLAAAAALALVVISPRMFDRGDRPELRELVEAVGTNRRTEARLTGGFEWGPVPSVTRGSTSGLTLQIEAAAASVLGRFEKGSDWQSAAAAATGHTVLGSLDEALRALEHAAALDPSSAAVWSDLSAVHLERARVLGSAEAPDAALRAADRALALADSLPEALFNRALALERLGRTSEARDAWARYLEAESDPLWNAEARARLGALGS